MTTSAPVQLDDRILDAEADLLAPMDRRFPGHWDRIEDALGDLPHGQVSYRWIRYDERLWLMIDVPLDSDPGQKIRSDYRRRVHDAVHELDGDRSIVLTWADPKDDARAAPPVRGGGRQ